jgi:Ca-activated chloride channel family protein
LEQFAEPGLLAQLMPAGGTEIRYASLILRLGVLAALVVALAGPRWGFKWQEVRREGIDLIVAVDTSRSMLATDVAPNRLERAKLAVLDVLPRLRGDRVGLVPFAGAAFLECPLTLDYTAFSRSLRGLTANTIPLGGTDLAQATEVALDAFESGESRYQALILITDGEDHADRVLEAAETAAARGIKIYTVGIGTAEGELIPLGGDKGGGYLKDRKGQVIKSRLDEETLGLIAATTGGAYAKGVGPSLGLDRVFDEHIATMERREISSKLERRHEQRFQIPLAVALALLFIEIALSRKRAAAAAVATIALLSSAIAPAAHAADPMEAAREGYAAYRAELYDEAINAYREALLDEPDSPMLRFNLADALYRKERFEEAAAEFAKVAQTEDASWHGRATYNLGNSLFRVGEAVEEDDPAAAAECYAESLAAYRRAMSADPADVDPKHGYEYVAKHLERLQEQQEEQQQEQPQDGEQNQDAPSDEQQESEPSEDSEASENDSSQEQESDSESSEEQEDDQQESTANEEKEPEEEQQQPSANEQDPSEQENSATAQDSPASAAGGQPQEPSEEEKMAAQAVLDAAKSEELTPEEVDRGIPIRGGRPVKDW